MSDKIQRYSLTEHGSLIEDDNGSWCFASVVDQQDAELERVRRELEEAKEFRAILEGHLSAAIDDYNDALIALKPFAEEAACYDPDTGDGDDNVWATPVYFKIRDLRNARSLRAKAEETGRG